MTLSTHLREVDKLDECFAFAPEVEGIGLVERVFRVATLAMPPISGMTMIHTYRRMRTL